MSDIRFNRWLHQSGTGGVYQDSSGRVGIGTSVPTSALDVQSGSIKIGSNTLSSTGVSTFTTLSATNIVGVSTLGVTTAYINTLSGISTIDASAAVSINQNLVFASGKGIDFSATANSSGTMTSELLNDYEEGTWTPVMKGNGTAGTWSGNSANGGFYIKVGRQVTCWANVNGTLSGASGDTRITGLPFTRNSNSTPSAIGNAPYSTGAIQYWSGISVQSMGPLIDTLNEMYFHTYTSTSTSGAAPAVVNTNHNLHFFVTYFTA